MTNRSRPLVLLLAALLLPPTGSALAQEGDASVQAQAEDTAEMLNGLAGALDPFSPADGDMVDPGDVDPSDPEADPGDPLDPSPAEPDEPGDDGEPGEIELPPSEPEEEGGFGELQLLPDPAPRAGRWTVTNKKGLVTCDTLGSTNLPRTTQSGRITVRDEGRVLVGRSLFEGQGAPVKMRWNPDLERYEGRVRAAAPGGRTTLDFYAYVMSANRMSGDMIATVAVDAGGVRERCRAARGLVFRRQ